MIRLTIPSLDECDYQIVREVLESGFLVQGPKVAAFELAVAQYVGVEHAVAVSSGTAALHLSLLALGVGRDDMVVTTAYSFPATANVIELCGAEPVFVDIGPDTYNIDPDALEVTLKRLMAKSETANRLKAILPVHTFGQLADMPTILALADHYELPVVEDAACALGASLHDRQAGSWGRIGCFSFHPRKAVTTGEGGMITTSNAVLARTLRALRNHGQDAENSVLDFIFPGFNYRMTELQGALGVTQMAKLDRVIAARRRLAAQYDQLLANSPVTPPKVVHGSQHVYQSYVGLLCDRVARKRGELIRSLREEGIETTIGTWHIPMTTYYRERYGHQPGTFPQADSVFTRSLTLPLSEHLSEEEQEFVADRLRGIDSQRL